MDASLFFSFYYFIYKKGDINGRAQLQWTMDKCHRGSSAFAKRRYCSHVQTHRGNTLSRRRQSFSHEEAKVPPQPPSPPWIRCFHHWATDVTHMKTYKKNDVSTSAFFPPSKRLSRFDFNAFCVVLYSHAKILLYLNVLILLNVLIFFFGYYTLELL